MTLLRFNPDGVCRGRTRSISPAGKSMDGSMFGGRICRSLPAECEALRIQRWQGNVDSPR